jgi:hypothetical protein
MKTNGILLAFLLATTLFLLNSSMQAQNTIGTDNSQQTISQKVNMAELILGVPKVSDKTIDLITTTIQKVNGVEFIKFCAEYKLVLIKYSTKLYPLKQDVIDAIKRQGVTMEMLIKEGTFAGVEQICQ